MRYISVFLALVAVWLAGSLESVQRPVRGDLLVAAAASLSGLAPSLTQAFRRQTGVSVRFNFAGSNTLARQIVEGARADVFISADQSQMDVVDRAGRLVHGSRVNVVGNQLVVIVPAGRDGRAFRVQHLASPAVERVAMGDPGAVPAGVYGRRWLEAARLWDAVQSKVIPLPSSPAAVAAVREQRADAGVVYASDAHQRHDVRVAFVVPVADAPEITYPAAVVAGGLVSPGTEFIKFLRSGQAQRIFASAGFRPLGAR